MRGDVDRPTLAAIAVVAFTLGVVWRLEQGM
jgi:hypothetical protein